MILNIFIHGIITEFNTAIMKIAVNINANIPALMRPTLTYYELCFLHVAHTCPDDRQSSHSGYTATVTSYIQVIQILKLRMETTSPYEEHTSCSSFFMTTSYYFWVTPSYIWVTQNTTLATSSPSSNVSLMGSTIQMT